MKNTKLIKVSSERYLPAELWTGILSRLPVKSLLRFRCVSTSWLSMIDDAEFAHLHLKNFKNNADETHLLVVDDWRCDGQLKYAVCCSDTFEITSETLLSIEGSWCFVCSVHGLVLLESFKSKASRLRKLKVWNPSIRKSHEFASLPEIERPPNSHFEDVDIGLGYDMVANAYKLVELMFVDGILLSVAVYSLGTGSWKMIPFRGKGCTWRWDPITIVCKGSVYSRGSLYFMPRVSGNSHLWELVSYDLSSEVFSSVSLPDDPFFRRPEFGWYGKILLIDGGCSVAVLDISPSPKKSVWVLESSGDERQSMCWTKRYSFHLDFFHFLCFRKNGDLLTWMCYESKSEKWAEVGSYNPETEEVKIVQEKRDSNFLIRRVSAYFESLVLLK